MKEPLKGIEPLTSSLPRKCSTTELQRLFWVIEVSRSYRSNLVSLSPMTYLTHLTDMTQSERKTRLELATYSLEGYRSTKWATSAYNLKPKISNLCCERTCGQGWIRTTELRRGQIYSLLPLATWLLARLEPLVGIEPTTYWLQISCSTSWAKVANFCSDFATLSFVKPDPFSPSAQDKLAWIKWIQIKSYPVFWEGKGKGNWEIQKSKWYFLGCNTIIYSQ